MEPKKHLFPLKIALRTQRLIQGSFFYGAFTDLAAGQYVRMVGNPEKEVKRLMLASGLSNESYEISWGCFVEYMNEFQHPIYQYGIYSMISHWDWYISKLGKFIKFAREVLNYPLLKQDGLLIKINRKPFKVQIEVLAETVGRNFPFALKSIDLIEEMNLVRNLGMHNLWEVDGDYLEKSVNKNWTPGQKREVPIDEIKNWHFALLDVVSVTSNVTAAQFANAPEFQ